MCTHKRGAILVDGIEIAPITHWKSGTRPIEAQAAVVALTATGTITYPGAEKETCKLTIDFTLEQALELLAVLEGLRQPQAQ